MQRIKKLVASRKFFLVLLGMIVASCLLFAVSITYKIPPDEYYHFRFIEYYANQPITDGPFITNQGLDFFDLRDITRIPNYLYHYLMSFPLRGMRGLTDSIFAQVLVLRLITLAMAIAGLFVLRRILRQVKASPFVQNSVLLLVSLTGIVLWTFSSVNYDVPAIVLYWLCLSVALSILQGKGIATKQLAAFALFAMLCVLVKVTFVPFLALLVLITIFLKRRDLKFKQTINFKQWKHVVLILAVAVTGFLFIERIGGNLVRYQQIEVSCDRVHTYQQCMEDDVFNRNETQLKAYAQQKADGRGVTYQPYQFTQMWTTFMYERSHFYYGHEQMRANYGAKIFAVMTAASFTALAVVFRKKLVDNQGEKLLLLVTASYALVMYVFNLQTWLKFGQPYAYQGRYLIPVFPFLYYFSIKLLILGYRATRGKGRQVFVGAVMALLIMSVYTHLPLLVFYRGSEAKWYSEPTKDFHLRVQDSLRKLNIKPIL